MTAHNAQTFRLCFALFGAASAGILAPAAVAQGGSSIARDEELVAPRVETSSVVIDGRILDASGFAIAGAMVVSSAGGSAVSESDGSFLLEVADCPRDACVEVTAVATVGGRTATSNIQVRPTTPNWSVGSMFLQAGANCSPSWLSTFGGKQGVSGDVYALTVFDDGSGPALFAGGWFSTAGGVVANYLAKWDGSSWTPLGSGMNSTVKALAVYDDGSGPALYAGGHFTTAGGVAATRIARWDGSSWSSVGGGMDGTVSALTTFDDGAGPALYAGGQFTTAGGVAASKIAKWDGSSWSTLGSGMDTGVNALAVFDDGSGPALYAGGHFTTAGGMTAKKIAKWDGASWSNLGSAMKGSVNALTVFDDGSGPALFVGGSFWTAGGVAAIKIAKWDGAGWLPLGSGMPDGNVEALTVFDDGGGPALYAGGQFSTAGGVAASRIAKWDGSDWLALGGGVGNAVSGSLQVQALTVFDDGGGPTLYAGGNFTTAGGVEASYIAQWDVSGWSALGGAVGGSIDALAVLDDGGGPALYASGVFTVMSGVATNRIAKWDGSSWSPLGSGIGGGLASSLAAFDDGSGPALYAGGDFTSAGGVPANGIAKWDGSSWSALGSGVAGGSLGALAVLDDGGGPALYAGGDFTSAGGVPASGIARWDGSSWSALGSGIEGVIRALAVFDDGSGPALYAGGGFDTAGGVPASKIAKWDGSSWSALGIGLGGQVHALTALDDGSGQALYAGGQFMLAGGGPALRVAKWDGSGWSALGSGPGNGVGDHVLALSGFDDGSGPALYAGGKFVNAGGVATKYIAKWDGSGWSALQSAMNGWVKALMVFDDGSGTALYAGGDFIASPAGDSYLAKWGCEAPPPTTYCTAGTSASGCQALLSATGTPSASAPSGFSLHAGTVEGQKDGLFFFGTNGQQANSWGNSTSFQCVVPPVKRAGVLAGTGTNGVCNGAFSQDLNTHWQAKPNHNPGTAAVVQAQLWYRDPLSTSNQTMSLSDAIEFVVGP